MNTTETMDASTSASATTLKLEEILNARFEITQQERNAIKEALDSLEVKIKALQQRIGPKPRETIEGIANALKALEHEHSTTSQTKADERHFMKEMEKLKQKRKLVQDYQRSQDELDAYKEKRGDYFQELRDKDKSLDELHNGVRKVRTASKLQCSTTDVIEQVFTLPEEALPRVIGKGGQTLRSIETDAKVSIEAERTGGVVRIMGTEASIALAYGAIMNIVNTSSIEISPADETIVCLLLNKASFCQDLQARHNVRIDVSRAKKVCKITGLATAIAAAVVEINSTSSYRQEIDIETSMLPSIVGKGGSVIRTLEEDQRVQIDIAREENKIIVLGFRPDVERTLASLNEIITENKEIEENISANRHIIITCIIGPGGQTARQLQKDLNVGIRVERADDDTDLDTILIRGTNAKVLAAKNHLLAMLKGFYAQTCRVEVPTDCLPLIVGKKGARINSMRQEYPGASIDIEGSIVYIQSPSEETRTTIKSIIETLVTSNFNKSIPLHPDVAISLKGQRGAELRNQLSSVLELGFEIDTETKSIRLRGTQENVEKGTQALEQFMIENYCEDLVCDGDDCLALMSPILDNGDPSYKIIEGEFKVDVYISRKENILKIRGKEADVKLAVKALVSILNGNLERGSILLPVNKMVFSALIGKGGVTLKKIETDNDVKLDLLKTKGFVRIRGVPEKLLPAKENIIAFLDDVKTTATISCQHPAQSLSKQVVDNLQTTYNIEMIQSNDGYLVKGLIHLVDLAQEYIEKLLQPSTDMHVSAPSAHLTTLKNSTLPQELLVSHQVEVKLDYEANSVILLGAPSATLAVKQKVLSFFLTRFPTEYVSIAMSLPVLQDMASKSTNHINQTTGAIVDLDLLNKVVYISGAAHNVKSAVEFMKQKQQLWDELHPTITIEDYLLPTFVGKNGAAIVQLERETHVKIRVNRQEKRLDIEGSNKEVIASGMQVVNAKVEQLRACHWEVHMHGDVLGAFIGKEGANIKKCRQETNANIDVDNKTGALRVTGEVAAVALARTQILAFMEEEEKHHFHDEIPVIAAAYPFVLGSKGLVAKDIQSRSGVRLELDRVKQVVVLRGTKEECALARELIEDILVKNNVTTPSSTIKATANDSLEQTTPLATTGATANDNVATKTPPAIRVCPGAPPSLIQQQMEKQMSSKALRRFKKKQNSANNINNNNNNNNNNGGNSDNEEPETDNGLEKMEKLKIAAIPPGLTGVTTTAVAATTTTTTNAPRNFLSVATGGLVSLSPSPSGTTTSASSSSSSSSSSSLQPHNSNSTNTLSATTTTVTATASTGKAPIPAHLNGSSKVTVPPVVNGGSQHINGSGSTTSDGKYFKSKTGLTIRL